MQFDTTQLPDTIALSTFEKSLVGVPMDEIDDNELRALVIDILIPDEYRLSIEERFEENFVDLL